MRTKIVDLRKFDLAGRLVQTFPKSGTTYLENLICNLPDSIPMSLCGDRECIVNHGIPVNGLSQLWAHGRFAIKLHIDPTRDNLNALVNSNIDRLILIHRDPRDVVVSMYHHFEYESQINSNNDHVVKLRKMSTEEKWHYVYDLVFSGMSDWIEEWSTLADQFGISIFLVDYLELCNDPADILKNIVQFVGDDISYDDILNTVNDVNNRTMSKRKFSPLSGAAGTKSTFRKGGTGGWKTEFPDTLLSRLEGVSEK